MGQLVGLKAKLYIFILIFSSHFLTFDRELKSTRTTKLPGGGGGVGSLGGLGSGSGTGSTDQNFNIKFIYNYHACAPWYIPNIIKTKNLII